MKNKSAPVPAALPSPRGEAPADPINGGGGHVAFAPFLSLFPPYGGDKNKDREGGKQSLPPRGEANAGGEGNRDRSSAHHIMVGALPSSFFVPA